MVDFITQVKDVLEEKGLTTKNMFEAGIISEDTFYKYKNRCPSLKTLLKVANYLGVTIDYLFEMSDENNFTPYLLNQNNLYNNILTLVTNSGISQRKFSKDLHFSRVNLLRWKKGITPNVQSLIEISNYFNCPINDLLDKQ